MGFVGGLATTSTTNRRHGEAVTGRMRRPPLGRPWFEALPGRPIDLARGSAPRYAVLRLHLANLGGELV
jgi:hypothetical protein